MPQIASAYPEKAPPMHHIPVWEPDNKQTVGALTLPIIVRAILLSK